MGGGSKNPQKKSAILLRHFLAKLPELRPGHLLHTLPGMAVPAPAPAHPTHSNRINFVLCTVSGSFAADPNPYWARICRYSEYPESPDIKDSVLYPPELQPAGIVA